ncbi:hypothetical protein RN001_008305 [Aquatica leii]|uniref:Hydrocephalus-inducing protein n=1 Tax=Aquatica leii TaxID=1421715 RepID=A0AAN7PX99_9COLE|nr:hypothetical protein RN001_008305 [Aquatica leii]
MSNPHTYPPLVDTKDSILGLIRKLVNDNSTAKEFRVPPSMFMEEMKLTTEERLDKLRNATYKPKMMPTSKTQIFIPIPEVIVFQNYKPGVVYTTSFAMRNSSTLPKPLRVTFPSSPYFSVTYASESISTHIASGIAIVFNVKFSTDDVKDYKYDATFTTEDETITFTIYALRPRPLLDLPDEIILPTTAVRVPTEKCIFTRNLGEAQANFLTSTNLPFSIDIDKGILMPNDLMKLGLCFNPTKFGKAVAYLSISFDTGETLSIKLKGITENANLSFEKGALHFHKTFMGMTRKRNVILFNKSKYNVKFQWKLYGTKEEENANLSKIKNSLKRMKSNETTKSNKLESLHIIGHEGHSNVYERIYKDELQELQLQEQYPYQNPYFKIVPMSGDIFANNQLEFTIFFTPTYVGNYNTRGFLDVTGRETRMTLILNGSGIGPYIELNMESLDANKLYMCAVHQYEVVAMNKGDIPGTITFPQQEMEFGGNLSSDPSSHSLQPSECGRFNLKFSSRQQGNFFEEVIFTIEESSENLRLILIRRKLTLHNSSMVPIEFKFFVYGDGDIPAVTCKEYAYLPIKCGFPKRPREFDYSQRSGSLSLTANIIRQVQTSLMLRMWDSDRHTISIPLSYRALTPRVVCIPPEVNIRFCYLTYPYYRNITLRNESNLSGFVELNLPGTSQMKGIQCSISKTDVFIKPHENVEVHMVVKTNYLGEDRIPIFMSLLGGKPFQCCSVICRGQGPVIGVSAEDLDFGQVKLLEVVTQEIKITNDSPIVAPVTITIPPNCAFIVEPTEFILQIEQSIIITLSICLYDPIRVQNTIIISAEQGNEVSCTLKAKGYGCSIKCEPVLEPELNVGLLLTYQDFRMPVTFTNKGIRDHKMMWTRNKQVKILKEGLAQIASTFTFRPSLLVLSAQDTMLSVIRGYSTKVGLVNEEYHCQASINDSNAIDIIMSFNIKGTFVEPRLEISKKEIKFVQNFGVDFVDEFTKDDIVITNTSQVPLSLNVVTEEPFYVEQEDKNELCVTLSLKHGESYKILVSFCPTGKHNRCYVLKSKLKLDYINHPKNDFINLTAEVNYPTVEIQPSTMSFSCLPPSSVFYIELLVKNLSPLSTRYRFEWQEESFYIEDIDPKQSWTSMLKLVKVILRTLAKSKISEIVLQVVDFERTENKGSITRLPIVYYWHCAYQEINQKYCYVQIHDVLEPSVSMDGLVELPQESWERLIEMRSFLYPIICNFQQFDVDSSIFKMLPKDVYMPHLNKTILDITPSHGGLKPLETQIVSVFFQPLTNTSVLAEAICYIDGGANEPLNIDGKSCQLSYSIETVQVDFGRQIFCEVSEKAINLKNTSLVPFSFSTSAKEVPKFIPSTIVLESGGLTVTPKEALLQSGESIKLHIQYLPGISGEFNEIFTLKVGYLPNIEINVHGYGDFPQVYLGDRMSFYYLPYNITYWAIATITTQYLKSLKNINYVLRFINNMSYEEDLPKYVCRKLTRKGWVVISYQDLYPSVMDIDMAIERMILYNHVFDNPSVLSKHLNFHKDTCVPDFTVPEYVLDLGYVIMGDKTIQKVQVFNYGPTNTRIKLLTGIDKRHVLGLDIEPMRAANMEVGQTRQISVSFQPSREAYKKEPDKLIEYNIFLDVAHGPRIPICICANVTVPKLEPNLSLLNFGEVRCGNLKKRSLVLYNNGFVQSNYTAIIQKKQARRYSRVDVDLLARKVFYLIKQEGTVNPYCKCNLDVYFEPQVEGHVEWELSIIIDKNPKKIDIVVKGLGRMPVLKIFHEIVEFKPVLPHSPLCEKQFRIQNTSALPVEFYFSDFDMEIDTEDKVLNLLCEFYSTNQLILPPRKPGQKLPQQFFMFYQLMIEELNKKLIKISLNNVEDGHINSLEDSIVTLCSGRRKSSTKRKSASNRSGISVNANRLNASASLLPKDPDELEVLLKDYVRDLPPEEKCKYDPIGDAIAEYKNTNEKKEPPLINEGVYFIFHGCRLTNYSRAANKAGLVLNIPVYTIDELIIECLVKPQDSNAHKIKDTINKEYLKLLPIDPIQEFEHQIKFILKMQSNPAEKKDLKKEKKPVEKNTFLGIPEEAIFDLLKLKLASFNDGVIIESLYSTFILEPYLALFMLLKAIGNVRYLHCIILSYNYEQFAIFEKKVRLQQQEENAKNREEKLERMIEMEPDELSKLSADDYNLFVTEKRLLELRVRRARPRSKKGASKKPEVVKTKAVDSKKDASKQSAKGSPAETVKEPQVFEKFDEQLMMIMHLLENWDRKLLICTKPLAPSNINKSSKTAKSSKSITPTKITSKLSLVKSRIEFNNLSPEQELKILQNGVPLEEMIAMYLDCTPDFKQAILTLQESIKENIEETIELRTVVYATKDVRVKNHSTVFFLKNVVEDQPIKNTDRGKSTASTGTASKKRRSRSRSMQETPVSKPSGVIEDLYDPESDKFTVRMVLSAGGRVRFRVLFKPELLGNYEHTFTLQLIGWPTKFYITCQGKADIPKLNMMPEIIFPKVMKKRTKKTQYYNNIFLTESNVFDFGPVLSFSKVDPKILSCETEFNFKNTSLIPCVTTFSIYKNPTAFEFDKNVITIAPGVTEVLNIRALPIPLFEVSEDRLIISIKDNPVIYVIDLKSESCKLTFALTPKVVRFDRILVSSVKEEIVTFHNKSLVPLCWELTNLEKLMNYFRVIPTSGCVEPEDTQKVVVQFYSEIPKTIPKQQFIVDLYDKDYRSIMPIHTESIDIVAEAMLVPITCETDLDLGEVKGQTENVYVYEMVAKGKYNVEFSFTPVTKADDPQFKNHKMLRSYFNMVPATGLMIPQKPFEVDMKYFCKQPVTAKKVPLFNVMFVDPLKKTFIKAFTLTVTFCTKFSTYELSPPEEIHFGYQLVGSEKLQTLTLANHGDFKFDYKIQKTGSPQPRSKKSKEKDTDSKKGTGKDTKKSKSEVTDDKKKGAKVIKLDFGCFTLNSSAGTVEAKTNAVIQVLSKPTQLGLHKETLTIYITQTQEPDINGRPFSVLVDSMFPTVNFCNINGIFREQFVVNNMPSINNNMLNSAIFIKEESLLYFPCKIINKEVKAQLKLENTSPVSAELLTTTVSPDNVFLLKPKLISIEPYSECPLTVSFIPNSINTFSGNVTISYRGLDAYKLNSFQMKLLGEGIVPRISLTKPIYDPSLDSYCLNFTPTVVNTCSTESIEFENVGILSCTVILEICEGTVDVFSLKPCSESEKYVKVHEKVAKTTAHANGVSLEVRESAKFYLKFIPTSTKFFKSILKLHTINNPYEIITIHITGEGYEEDVILQDLETYLIKTEIQNNICTTGYYINFDEVFVGKHHTKSFRITNVSLIDIYKFEFTPTDKITFMPVKGHLKPNACKEVTVTFFSKEALNVKKVQLECALYKIVYVNSELEGLSWDDRQTVVAWEPNDMCNLTSTTSATLLENPIVVSPTSTVKLIKEKEEPPIEVVPNTIKYVSLLVSAVCDYASYKCSVKRIVIDDTYAFERKSETFEVSSTSNVSYSLEWTVGFEEIYTTKETETSVFNDLETSDLVKAFTKTLKHPIPLTGREKFLEDDVVSKSSSESSMFSSEGNILNLGDDPYISDEMPFEVTPYQVIMNPNETKLFTVTFAPKDIFSYLVNLKAKIPNLNPAEKRLVITTKANSLLPLYYFDVPENDYVTTRRKALLTCQDLVDKNVAVIEFEAIGLGSNITRIFNVLNPTTKSFMYKWEPLNTNSNEISPFHCHCLEGVIENGKMIEAVFTFISRSIGTLEALYKFTIKEHDVQKILLLVGHTREPLVHFSTPSIQIRPSVLGLDINEHILLKNTEDFEVVFKFRKDSLYSEAHQQSLTVEPMKGVLAPRGERQIKITYHAVKVGEIQFTLRCAITKMKKPITLIVNALCFEIKPHIYYDGPDRTKIFLTNNKVNTLEIKSMMPLVKKEIAFAISNVGETGFYYSWSVNEGLLGSKVELHFCECNGFVPIGQEIITTMTITLLTKVVIRKLVIRLQIRYGPTYIIHLSSAMVATLYNFSFSEYDFGPCLVQKEVTSYYKVALEFTNSDESSITLECKAPVEDCLTIKFNSKRIQPKSVEAMEISFHPFKVQQYNIELMFYINSQPHTIRIRGEGVPIAVRLKDCNDKFLNFGSVPVGKTSSISVVVLNDGLSPIEIIFDIPEKLPFFLKPKKNTSEFKSLEHVVKASNSKWTPDDKNKKNAATKEKGNNSQLKLPVSEKIDLNLLHKFINITPKRFIKVGSKQSTQFVITFSPTERIANFSEKLAYQVQDTTDTLCIFKGCSIGADYYLDKKCIPFGTVVLGYSSKQKFVLNNAGDIGGTFKWTFEKPQTNFSITPDNGYISPHTTVVFIVQFKPSILRNLFQEKLKCQITNFMKPLEVLVNGSSSSMPSAIDKIHFECPVRENERKIIAVENNSPEERKISTTLTGQYFFTKEIFTIAPKSILNCEVGYKPLMMTHEHHHEGSIFFAFPEGQGLLYYLVGTTKPPLVVKKISIEIKSKTLHHEVLDVKNWLMTPQTFQVKTDTVDAGKVLYNITSNDTLEVLGSAIRPYTWSIYALNEGLLNVKVTFKNKDTKEYLFYEISLNVMKCLPLDVITLSTCLRQPISHSLTLENPLKYSVTFTIKASVPELSYPPTITVKAHSKHEFIITYKPTIVGETDARIEIVSPDLGTYPYDLKLFAKLPIPEKVLTFVAKLGQTVVKKTQMTNSHRTTVTFEVECTHPEIFYLDGALTVGADVTKEFAVNFEPMEIGTVTSTLTISSPQTGTYIYTLNGTCEMPQPQGPFFIIPGNNINITFKNPFNETMEFRFVAEPAIFSIKSEFQSLKARTDVKVSINLVPMQNLEVLIDRKYAITGRLTVYPINTTYSHIKWVYYLHGDLNS